MKVDLKSLQAKLFVREYKFLRYLLGLVFLFLTIAILESGSFVVFRWLNLEYRVDILTQFLLALSLLNLAIYFKRSVLIINPDLFVCTERANGVSTLDAGKIGKDVKSIFYTLVLQAIHWLDWPWLNDRKLLGFFALVVFSLFIRIYYNNVCLGPISFRVIKEDGGVVEISSGGVYLLGEGISSIFIEVVERNTAKPPQKCFSWYGTQGVEVNFEGCYANVRIKELVSTRSAIIEVRIQQCQIKQPFHRHLRVSIP